MWVNKGIAPSYLTSALDGGQSSASRPGRFTPGYSLDKRLCGPQSLSGRFGERGKFLALAEKATPAVHPIVILTELAVCRLLLHSKSSPEGNNCFMTCSSTGNCRHQSHTALTRSRTLYSLFLTPEFICYPQDAN
jgi:hypothetical protein